MNRQTPLFLRFYSKVRKTSKCWWWMASRYGNGYGQAWDGKKIRPAHRLAYYFEYGSIPAGLDVCHHCDHPLCVRPTHLFLDTAKGNLRNASEKGRTEHGERHHSAKLTTIIVQEIRESTKSNTELGKLYKVARRTISDARRGITWKQA